MPTQFETILGKLSSEEREQIESVLKTTAMQAELIGEMSRDLVIHEGAAILQRDAMQTVTLTKLGELLSKPVVKGPTVQEINESIETMRNTIQSAQSGKEAFDTIFGFAVKIAPLLLA